MPETHTHIGPNFGEPITRFHRCKGNGIRSISNVDKNILFNAFSLIWQSLNYFSV